MLHKYNLLLHQNPLHLYTKITKHMHEKSFVYMSYHQKKYASDIPFLVKG